MVGSFFCDEWGSRGRGSKSRRFLATKPVNPPKGKVQQCWVFEQPKAGKGAII